MDYEYLFAESLHEKLKKKIVGKIFVKIMADDVLYVKIESYGGLVYTYRQPDFAYRLIHGLTTEYAACDVVSDFKKFILKKYTT